MEATKVDKNEVKKNREDRFVSHALVEVRKFKGLPFFCHSAVLLDISTSGFKIEFTSEINIEPGSKHWLSIPLSPLGIYAPKKLFARSECRWFDDHRYRMGGIFVDLNRSEITVVEQVIASLKGRDKP